MNKLKRDMARIQTLMGDVFDRIGELVVLSDGGQMAPERLQRTLKQTMDHSERSAPGLHHLCETYSPSAGDYQRRAVVLPIHTVKYVEQFEYGWLHIVPNTLLSHCHYQTPAQFSDTLARLFDDYEEAGCRLPYFQRAMLVINEHGSAEGRHIYDPGNKGWKAVSNALEGRLFPDDNQYTLTLSLLSARSAGNVCHITLLDLANVADFFAIHSEDYGDDDLYSSRQTTQQTPSRFPLKNVICTWMEFCWVFAAQKVLQIQEFLTTCGQ